MTLLLAAKEGEAEPAAAAIEAAGGTVAFRDDELGYLRVELPLERVSVVERIESIQAADVDEVIPLPDPRPDASEPARPRPPPGPDTPNDNRYMPDPARPERRSSWRRTRRGTGEASRSAFSTRASISIIQASR